MTSFTIEHHQTKRSDLSVIDNIAEKIKSNLTEVLIITPSEDYNKSNENTVNLWGFSAMDMDKSQKDLEIIKENEPVWDFLERITADVPDEVWDKFPSDYALNHDKYLYGGISQ